MSRSVHQSSELKSSVPLKLTTMRFGFVSDALNTKACVRFFSWNADHKNKNLSIVFANVDRFFRLKILDVVIL